MSRADRNRLLRELTERLHARGVDAVFHPAPPWTHGHGWIALQADQGQVLDAVWYVPAGAYLGGQRLDGPRLVWGGHFQHQAAVADDLAATADQIATHAAEPHAGQVTPRPATIATDQARGEAELRAKQAKDGGR